MALADLVGADGRSDQGGLQVGLRSAYGTYSGLDGYWDAMKALVTLPSDLTWDVFERCPTCYLAELQEPPPAAQLFDKMDELAIQPLRDLQALVDAHEHVTRLYTTLSADEMTVDPLFTFNPDLPDVSNIHTADRVVECTADVTLLDAPWRIELPQGGSVRGTADDLGNWPADFASMPPNRIITRLSDSGPGKQLEDNTDAIDAALDAYNATRPPAGQGGQPGQTSAGGSGGSGTGAKGGSGSGAKAGTGAKGGTGGLAKAGRSGTSGGSGGTPSSGDPDGGGQGGSPGDEPVPAPGAPVPARRVSTMAAAT